MVKRTIAAVVLALFGSLAASAITDAFNDKGLIIHNGKLLCIDWHGWTQHRLHGDPKGGDPPHTCDTP